MTLVREGVGILTTEKDLSVRQQRVIGLSHGRAW
jgi:hypothetical protein